MFLKDISYLNTIYKSLIIKVEIISLKQKDVSDLFELYYILNQLDVLSRISSILFVSLHEEGSQKIRDAWISLIGVCKSLDLDKLIYKNEKERTNFRKIYWKIVNKFDIEATKRYHQNFVGSYNIEFLRPKCNDGLSAHYNWERHIYNNKKNPLFKDLSNNFDIQLYSNAVGKQHEILDHYKIYQSNSPGVSYDITWPPRKETGLELFERTYDLPNDFRGFISNCIQEHFIDFNNKNCTVVDLFNFDKPKSLTLKLSELIETNKVLIGQITESFKISHNKAIGIMSKLIFVPVYTDDNNKILPSTTKIQNDYISLLPITDSKIETENYFFAVAQVFCEEIYKSDSLNLNKSLVFGFQELLSIYFREKISVKSMKYPRLSFLDCACYEIIMNILIGKELHMISKSRVDDILNYIAELENELKCEHLDIIILEHLSRFDIYDFIARSRKNYVDSKIKFEINKIDLDELIDYFS